MPTLAYGEYSIRPTAKDAASKTSLSDSLHFFKTLGTSSFAVSSTIAKASTNSIQIKFTGALDTKYAIDLTRFDVLRASDGTPLSVQTASYNSTTNTVTLNIMSGSIQAGDKVNITVNNMFDSTGKMLNKQTSTATATV